MKRYTIKIAEIKKVAKDQTEKQTTESEFTGDAIGAGDHELFKTPMKPLEGLNILGSIKINSSEVRDFFMEALKSLGYSPNMTMDQKRNIISQVEKMMREKYKDVFKHLNI